MAILKKIRFTWSLRTMMVCMVVFALLLSWVSRRHRLVSRCEKASWRVCFEFEFDENGCHRITFDRTNNSAVMPIPHGPEFLRESLGLAYFNQIRGVHVSLNTEADHQLFEQLSSQPSITFVRIEQGELKPGDVKTITALSNLRLLHVDTAAMTVQEIRSLKKELHPKCELYIRRMEPPQE